ncbi:LLM class flavin-dependent oxidoreductase [Mycobacterium frederiksbergense]|uniref:LLM class flavin-dependent oxidoreductase n=2 Tax=Mycolicibacterium frederiksbergense TaxID=117567 RepID=UPI0021F27F15|nr:LLM class flavin-dependent oxidoreductase [Mycolicibacterium frederiksbergense]MCV7043297.1 LLM class flavin-dependent oxidoreductase [Mycolicibacterium frederiksbergense]
MKGIGLSLPNRGILFGAISVAEMLELAEFADRGEFFDSVWVGDGLIAKPRVEAVASLAAISARTTRVQLGVCCLATFPLRQPVVFAAQWASLDVLSGGRALLAVCLGATTERSGGNVLAELTAAGITGRERVPRLEEGVRLVRALWSGPTSWDGQFWSFPEVSLEPRPIQDPCPIWIASNPDPDRMPEHRYRAAIERVATLADGWQTAVTTPEDFGRKWDEIQSAADAAGRDASALTSSAHLMINLAGSREEARAEGKRFLDTYYSMDSSDEILDRWGAFGTPEQVMDRIDQYLAVGLDVPVLRFASFDQPGQMELAEQTLLPELQRRRRTVPAG